MATETQICDQGQYQKYQNYASAVVQRVVNSGRLSDRSTISPHIVPRNLKGRSPDLYDRVWAIWLESVPSRKQYRLIETNKLQV